MAQLDPVSLKLFISVVEQGTIAAAAEREHIAAAAISKRISEIEASLQVELLRRTNKGVAPTAAGEALLALARHALYELDDIAVQMRSYASGASGLVRVVANVSAIVQFLPAEIKHFMSAHPQVQVRLEERVSSQVIKAVAENAADVGVFTVVPHGYDLQTFPYHRDRLVVVTPRTHALAHTDALWFAQTLEHDYVGLHSDSAINQQLGAAANQQGRALRLRIQVTSYDALCLMIAAGLGIGIMPHAVATQHTARLALHTIALHDAWALRELRIGVRDFEALPAAGKLLVRHLSEPQPAG
jgi:DNA-binding transcriptional LysR family regulator